VVYVDGAFDLLNPAHIAFLAAARALGDFLLVGIHTDNLITHYRGPLQPVAPMEDRALCLLANKHVSDVVLGVPWVPTKDMIASLGITIIAAGSVTKSTHAKASKDDKAFSPTSSPTLEGVSGEIDEARDPYHVAKEMGIFHEIPSTNTETALDIMHRIASRREDIVARNSKSAAKEKQYEVQKSASHEDGIEKPK